MKKRKMLQQKSNRRLASIFAAVFTVMYFCFENSTHAETEHDIGRKNIANTQPGVFEIPISLPPSLESKQADYRREADEAQLNVRRFAEKYGWAKYTDQPLVERIEIFATKDDFDKHIYESSPEMRGKPIPKTFTAAVEKNTFIAVSPEVFEANCAVQDKGPGGYVKLLTHELAHRLEVRLVNGDEDKMGPMWFFEGFAIFAADQYAQTAPELSEAEIWNIVAERERGSYPKYRTVFTHFLKMTTIDEYLKHATEKDFDAWLHTLRGK